MQSVRIMLQSNKRRVQAAMVVQQNASALFAELQGYVYAYGGRLASYRVLRIGWYKIGA